MNPSSQRGFGMLEILITLVVVAFGVLAHVTFQKIAFHEAGQSVSRAQATELATQKIEDLRTFGCLKTGTAACSFAYQDIATNLGGAKNASGQLLLPSATPVTVGNTSYTRSWTVTEYWYTGTGVAPTTTAPTGNPLASFKGVTVTISWTDSNGTAQSLSLYSLIAGADPALAAQSFQ